MPEGERLRQRVGIQILFDFSDITSAIDFAAQHRFGVLEINLGNIRFGEQLQKPGERERLRRQARRARLKLAIHALEGPSLFTPSRAVHRCAVRELKRTLRWAGDIGAENVVMHLGFDMHYGLGGTNRYTHQEFPRYYELVLAEAFAELKEYARDKARLCVENVGGFRYAPSQRILSRVLGENLGLCFDTGHIAILPPKKRKRELTFFRRFSQLIYHSHIHHNNGVRDEHLPLGEGSADVLPYLRLLICNSPALLVMETRPKEAALRARNFLLKRVLPELK